MPERVRNSQKPMQKFTTLGESYEEVEQQAHEARRKIELMEQTIDDTLNKLGRTNELKKEIFFFIHVNYFCKDDLNVFYPAEIAVVAYSIEEGVKDYFHTAINPGNLPKGYNNKAKVHTDDTHKMPLPPYAMGEIDSAVIVNKIIDYVRSHSPASDGKDKMPPFYTLSKMMDFTESIFTKWSKALGMQPDIFRIYRLDYLFHELKLLVLKPKGQRLVVNGIMDMGFIDVCQASNILLKDEFSYRPNISCDFHEEGDNVVNCSRSYVTRWGWMLSTHLCADMDVTMIAGQHCPVGSNLSKINVRDGGLNITIYGKLDKLQQAGYKVNVTAEDVSEKPNSETSSSAGSSRAPENAWKIPDLPTPANAAPAETNAWKTPWKMPNSRHAATKGKGKAPVAYEPESSDFPAIKRRSQLEKNGTGAQTQYRKKPKEKSAYLGSKKNYAVKKTSAPPNKMLPPTPAQLEAKSTKSLHIVEPKVGKPQGKVNKDSIAVPAICKNTGSESVASCSKENGKQAKEVKQAEKQQGKPEEKGPTQSTARGCPNAVGVSKQWQFNVNAPCFKPRNA